MNAALPTGSFGNWTVTRLKDSLISALAGDGRADGAKLRFYFYAVTLSGWAGSNNITRDGLVNNIEFAVAIRSAEVPRDLRCWAMPFMPPVSD